MLDDMQSALIESLSSFSQFSESIKSIPYPETDSRTEPWWDNVWFTGLDAVALYCLLCINDPKFYIEIGSGISTRFARRAIEDHDLRTKVISIDPTPRKEVDEICDTVIRSGLEGIDTSLFGRLSHGDILFMDGTHRCLMNSDVTVFFLDVLPQLDQGVFLHLHDIFLPHDYPPDCNYSEQYVLASWLLSGQRIKVVLPNFFVTQNPAFAETLNQLWTKLDLNQVPRSGTSFWLEMT
jgi:hypothetical protein